MSFAFDDTSPAWGPSVDPINSGDIVKDAIRKEQVIKYVRPADRDSADIGFVRDIAAAQNDLQGGPIV
jgi:hypothetical protein